jgi:hypothetical protein
LNFKTYSPSDGSIKLQDETEEEGEGREDQTREQQRRCSDQLLVHRKLKALSEVDGDDVDLGLLAEMGEDFSVRRLDSKQIKSGQGFMVQKRSGLDLSEVIDVESDSGELAQRSSAGHQTP